LRRRLALVVVALVALGAVIFDGLHSNPTRETGAVGALPKSLASERLFFADPALTGIYRADGTVIANLQATAGAGSTPIVAGDGVAVYIHGEFAYRSTVSSSAMPTEVARAQSVFPGLHGTVGLESDPSNASNSIEYLTSAGSLPPTSSPLVRLPPGTMAVAQLPGGLLVESGDAQDGPADQSFAPIQLNIEKPGHWTSLGEVSAVVAVHDANVAVAICTTELSTSCALRLTDTTTGVTRTVAPPPGFSGYAAVSGTFSPEGGQLAVFVASVDAYGGSHLYLTLIDVDKSAVKSVLPAAVIYDSGVITAAWSGDGRWIFFGSSDDPLFAQRVTDAQPLGEPFPLPFSTTSAVAGL